MIGVDGLEEELDGHFMRGLISPPNKSSFSSGSGASYFIREDGPLLGHCPPSRAQSRASPAHFRDIDRTMRFTMASHMRCWRAMISIARSF